MTATQPTPSKIFRPGDRAEASGIYRAVHLRHRMPHEITVLEKEIFPKCRKCGDRVKFELVNAAPRAQVDVDLLFGVCALLAAVVAAGILG